MTKDDFLGEGRVELASGKWSANVPIILEGHQHGVVSIQVSANEAEHHSGLEHPFKIHSSRVAGIITHSSNDRKTISPQFCTYTVEMKHVDEHFGSLRQGWNTQYDAAQKIFGDGLKSKSIRAAIRTQHKALYSEMRCTHGVISNGDDFLNLINFGRRDGQRPSFTYAITKNDDGPAFTLRFSETGPNSGKDFFSKHAMHAGCRKQVVYSGEFLIHKLDNGQYLLVIDNNSGTYSPNQEHLPRLQALFAAEFPGLHVEALHFADPKLKHYKDLGH
jgi:hypothetical protein